MVVLRRPIETAASDSDTFGDGDLIIMCPNNPASLDIDTLRSGEFVCANGGTTLTIGLNPE